MANTVKFGRVGEHPGGEEWGKTLTTDVNKALESIEKHFNKLNEDMAEKVTEAVVGAFGDVIRRLDATEDMVNKHEQTIYGLEKNLRSIQNENSKLKHKLRYIESIDRRSNLLFFGVNQVANESHINRVKAIKSILREHMGFTDEQLQGIIFLKSYRTHGQKHNECQPISVTFDKINDRKLIWDARKKLYNVPQYYIREDYAPEVEQERRKLYQIYNYAQQNKDYKQGVFVKFDKLICFGREYPCDSLHSLPAPINPRLSSELSTSEAIFFGGVNSDAHPLCNWYALPEPLEYNGHKYDTSEHAYLHAEALFARDELMAYNILHSSTPAEAKRLAHKIRHKNIKGWHLKKRSVMKKILLAKFGTKEMAKKLKDTGTKELHEAGKSEFWATGISLGNKNIQNKSSWTGKSVLGEVLMEIRAAI